jgi:bloom syndrome protein
MTRNNLDDHISWLLNNIALSKPVTIGFPTPTTGTSSFSVDVVSQSQSASQQTTSSQVDSGQCAAAAAAVAGGLGSRHVRGVEARGGAVQETSEVIRVDETMGRLTSTSKPKKPSLVSKAARQLPTPASGEAASNQAQSFGKLLPQNDGCTECVAEPF